MNLLSSVQEQLCRLSMKHASKELEGILENAQHHDWTPLQTLQALLAIELENRQDSGRLRRLKAANFPFHKTLEDFDFGFQNSVSKRQIQQLAEMAWLEGAYNIMFLGPPGVGKTHLAVALGIAAVLALYKEGIILGLPDGRFNPNSYITRAEMAVIIQRILDKIDEEEEEEEITGTISLPERVTLEQGERITLKATVKYSDGSDDYEITWTTSDKNVARVNQDGLVRAADDKTGVVYIKATATRDGKSISATCKVTVVEKDEIVSAQLERTGNMGIHDGKVYEEYRLEAGGDVISLDSDNVKRISLTKGDEEPVKLTPNSDSTLWFNVQKESATYTLRVQDMDDVIYEATLDWEGPEEVEATFTGREGINNGIQYREYQFEDLNLSDFTKMYQIKPDGTIVELTANSDVNLWFKISDQLTGEHIFLVLQDGQWYSATIEYED
jgi:hypothetical protein